MIAGQPWLWWVGFHAAVALLLLADSLLPGHRGPAKRAQAYAWLGTGVFILAAAGFAAWVAWSQGRQPALEFVAGYTIETSLSIDNLFVFLVIFNFFAVPERQQHRVLFWGVVGALVMRGAFILTGVGLIHRFHWLLYLFGALLIYSGIRLAFSGDHKVDPAANPLVKALRYLLPVTDDYRGSRFFVRDAQDKRLYATPLLVVLLVIETSDVLFSVDSIPAILAITLNAFIVYTSNVFAILGLRSIYFAVSGLIKIFRFLHYGLAVVLMLVGVKMLMSKIYPISTPVMLSMVAVVVGISVVASVVWPEKKN